MKKHVLLALANAKLDVLTDALQRRFDAMSKELDDLKAQVTANGTVTASAVTLLRGLSDQIRDLKDDPAALEQLATDLKGQSDALAAAVTANTPAEPTPPPQAKPKKHAP